MPFRLDYQGGTRSEGRREKRNSQDIRSITFIMYPHCQFLSRVPEVCGVTKDIYRLTPDGREEGFKITTSKEFGVHSASFCSFSSPLSPPLSMDIPSNKALLNNSSETSNLLANPGKCQTGSMAALNVFTSIPGSLLGKAGRI